MKYKVGDEVSINLPNCNYDKCKTKIRSVDANTGWYALDIDSGIYAWSENDLVDIHEDCGCHELSDLPKTKTDYKKFIEAGKRVAEVEAEAEESQKPSARISRGVAGHNQTQVATYADWITAILLYLDEQYEKENHERKRA